MSTATKTRPASASKPIRERRKGEWAWFDVAIMERLNSHTPNAMKVYFVLASRASSRDETCWPSVASIARETGMSDRTVQRALKSLVGAKLIAKNSRKTPWGSDASNSYTLLSPPHEWEGVTNDISQDSEVGISDNPPAGEGVTIDTPGCQPCQGEGDSGDRGRVSPVSPPEEPTVLEPDTKNQEPPPPTPSASQEPVVVTTSNRKGGGGGCVVFPEEPAWIAPRNRLRQLGLYQADEAILDARNCGMTPASVTEAIDFWEASQGAYELGALRRRLAGNPWPTNLHCDERTIARSEVAKTKDLLSKLGPKPVIPPGTPKLADELRRHLAQAID